MHFGLMSMHDGDPDEDALLTTLLRGFMRGFGLFLDTGPPEEAVDRVLGAATVTAAALLLAWPTERRRPGILGIVEGVGRQFWKHWKWFF